MNNILSDLKKAREEFRASGDGTLLAILVDQHFDELSELLAKKPLDLIMGVEEASAFWDLSPGTIKKIFVIKAASLQKKSDVPGLCPSSKTVQDSSAKK